MAAAKNDSSAVQNVTIVRARDDDLAGIVLTWFVQVTALAAAITFGIFSVLSWIVSQKAVDQANAAAQSAQDQANAAQEQANTANLLALAALCANIADQSNAYNGEVQGFCGQLFPSAWPALAKAAAKLVPGLTSISTPTTSISSPASSISPSTTSQGSISSSFHGSSSTTSATVTVTNPTVPSLSFAPGYSNVPPSFGSASPGELGTGAKVGLAVGFAIGVPVIFVTVLTTFRYRKLRREEVN